MPLSSDAREVLGAAAKLRSACLARERAEQRARDARDGEASFVDWARTNTANRARFERALATESAADTARKTERDAESTLIAVVKSTR